MRCRQLGRDASDEREPMTSVMARSKGGMEVGGGKGLGGCVGRQEA